LVQQVAVRGVDLDDVKSGLHRSTGGFSECSHDTFDSLFVERFRKRIVVRKPDRARSDRFPASPRLADFLAAFPRWRRTSLPARVSELNAGRRSLAVKKPGDPREDFDVLIFPEAEILRADAAFRGDGGGFGEYQTSASDGTAAEMDEVPIGGKSIGA